MKHIIKRMFLVALTFTVGIALTFAWREYSRGNTRPVPVRYLPILEISESGDYPQAPNDKEVRIRGILQPGVDWGLGPAYDLVSTSINIDGDPVLVVRTAPGSPAESKVPRFVVERQNQPFYERRKGQEVIVTGHYSRYFSCYCELSTPGIYVTDIEPVSLSALIPK